MQIHYFQRYHQKENVATANTMLLLSRLYSYSQDKFFQLLGELELLQNYNPKIVFTLQEKSEKSVPDATITQDSFKIVVETKLTDWFHNDQLENHLEAFNNETCKILISLASEPMAKATKDEFEQALDSYNKERVEQAKQRGLVYHPIVHKNMTFLNLIESISNVLDDRDYEMLDILADYEDYCNNDELIPNLNAWKFMRVQLAGTTFDFNTREGLYYDKAERGFRAHDYLGLYSNKAVRAVGKVIARIKAVQSDNGQIEYECEFGDLTDERKEKIRLAMADGDEHGYGLRANMHRYFFVDRFYDTYFEKTSKRAPMGSRIFDLSELLDIKESDKLSAEELARRLRDKTWN